MAMKEVETAPKKDNLFSATQIMPTVQDMMTVTADVKRGALIDAAGALITSSTAANVYAVVAADTAKTKSAPVYLTGEFNVTAVKEATGIEITAAMKQAARKIGIFLKTNIAE